MDLKSFSANKAASEFEVSKVEFESTESDGKKIAVLYLTNPIEMVEGSQTIEDGAGGTERVKAYDVETVRIHEDDFGADGIDIKDDGTGTVKCNLRLDVAKGTGDVWLKSKTFAQFGREKRGENKQKRDSGVAAKMQERKAAALLKKESANQPVSVSN